MTPEALQAALDHGAAPPKATPESPLQPLAAALPGVEDCALSLAHKHRLIGADHLLHCWNCGAVTDWHVSLHCLRCRAEEKRGRSERQRQQWLDDRARRAQQQAEAPSQTVQRVAGRRFRDEY